MNAWIDIFSLDEENVDSLEKIRKAYSQKDLEKASDLLLKIIQDEKALLPEGSTESNIIIGGFSQGCMVALAAFLKCNATHPLGGVMGLNGL